MAFGARALTAAISSTTRGCGSAGANEASYAQLTSFNANAFYTPPAPTGAVGVIQCLLGPGGTATRTVTFNRPVIAPVFNVVNLDASTLTFSAGPSGGAVALTTISKNAGLNLIGGTTLSSTVPMGTAPCSNAPPNPANNPGCGSFRIAEAGGPVTSFAMTNATKPGSASDGWYWSLSFPTVPLTKAFSASEIPAGGTTTLTFTIANPNNPGQPTLSPLDFTDVLPSGVALANGTATNNGNCGTPSVTDSGGGGLAAGDAGVSAANISVAAGVTCTITITVTSTTPGSYVNDTSNLSTSVVNLIPNASTPLTVSPSADVRIEKSASSPVVAGMDATYSLKVTNHGPSIATNVVVSDLLPEGLSFASASSGCAEADKAVACTIASLAAGASQTFEVTAHVASSAGSCAEVGNTATVTSDTSDPDMNNNSSTVCDLERRAELSIQKSTSATVVPGTDATYSLRVTNNGPSTATNVQVSDVLPSGLSFASASPECFEAGGTVTCTIASLAAGASQTFDLTAHVASSARSCADVGNAATVSSDTPDLDTSNNSSSVCNLERRASRSITKVASGTQVPTGGQVMYTLVVKNNGPSDDTNVAVSDPMAPGLSLVSAEASQGSCSTDGGQVSCGLGDLKAGGSAQVLVTARMTATSGCVTNTARVTGDGPDPSPDDNEGSATTCVPLPPSPPPPTPPLPPATLDLQVDKRASASRVTIGQRVTYTIVVINNGPGAAQDAKVTDTFNRRAAVVSVRTTAGSCTRRMPITCELGTIESGASVTITVVIKPRASGRARNAASATSCCGTDTTPDNNLATADIRVRKVTLRLTKVASRSSVRAGERFSYRIRVRNPTKGEARNVKVCDRLPSGLAYVRSKPTARASGGQRCWTIQRLKAGKSRTFRVTVRAARGANGAKTNTATASSRDATANVRAKYMVRVRGFATPVTG